MKPALADLRKRRGLSVISLAAAAGVNRQTVYAMEAGDYVPNTLVALKLARALDTTVEQLFGGGETDEPLEARSERVALLPGSTEPSAMQAVQLCQVDRRLMAAAPASLPCFFPFADGVMHGRAEVRVFHRDADFSNRILVAGCDPGISVLARHVQAAGIDLVLAHRNSSQALALLKDGCIHIAGTHLRDEESGESNVPEIGRLFRKNSVAAVSFAEWEEGILTAPGNPKSIQGVADFSRKDVRIVNREEGAGSRRLLDSEMKRLRMKDRNVRGYQDLAQGHLPAAWQVHAGRVDCCVATGGAARLFGLHFIPLAAERYDLVLRKTHLDLPRIQNLLDVLSRKSFRRELEGLGGYDMRVTGNRVV